MAWTDYKSGIAGVLVDHGTGLRIPFARGFDPETGEYEAQRVASNGIDMAVDENWKPIVYRGRAKGRLELVPWNRAVELNLVREPKKVVDVRPNIREGLEDYKKLYITVWQKRGECRRSIDERFDNYLRNHDFLDHLILRRRPVSVSTTQDLGAPGKSI